MKPPTGRKSRRTTVQGRKAQAGKVTAMSAAAAAELWNSIEEGRGSFEV
jgi:hypothetical protein